MVVILICFSVSAMVKSCKKKIRSNFSLLMVFISSISVFQSSIAGVCVHQCVHLDNAFLHPISVQKHTGRNSAA